MPSGACMRGGHAVSLAGRNDRSQRPPFCLWAQIRERRRFAPRVVMSSRAFVSDTAGVLDRERRTSSVTHPPSIVSARQLTPVRALLRALATLLDAAYSSSPRL